MNEPLMFFIDFDGTISLGDNCYTMVREFCREGWEEINRLWEQGTISTEECARRTLDLMSVQPQELEAFFNNVEIDESFLAFVNWAEQRSFPIYIVSDGYDNYIERTLERHALAIPYYANHLVYEEGWKIKCLDLNTECRKCGVCKTGLIKELKQPGYLCVYVGDGYSDVCPVEVCDLVFAKDNLARYCEEKGISFYHYHNFADVKAKLEAINR